jgi:hypothetical protein
LRSKTTVDIVSFSYALKYTKSWKHSFFCQ